MLDRAFEDEGFCVVRGPDLLWGGDVKKFSPPREVFDGVIGGPPCQAHVQYAKLNRSIGNKVSACLMSEFARIVDLCRPTWFLMENSSKAPDLLMPGYSVQKIILNAVLFGLEQNRARKFQFGSIHGQKISVEVEPLSVPMKIEKACLASEGRSGSIYNRRINGKQKSFYSPRRTWARFCELQGLPGDYLSNSPFNQKGAYRVVGNGVPIPMGRAVAKAVRMRRL